MLAGLLTGLIISLYFQEISLLYLVFFAVTTVFVAMFVESRGLFLTVVSIPLLFTAMTVATAWAITQSLSVEGSDPFSTTAILTAVYPLTQYFPWLLAVTLICLLIAVIRLWLLRRAARKRREQERRRRRRARARDRRGRAAAADAREHSSQITVEELLARRHTQPRGQE